LAKTSLTIHLAMPCQLNATYKYKESHEGRQVNYGRQYRAYKEGCNRGMFYISSFTLGTEEKNKELQGEWEIFLSRPTIIPRRPTKQKAFRLKFRLSPTCLFSLAFSYLLFISLSYCIWNLSCKSIETPHPAFEAVTNDWQTLHSNIPSGQRSSVGQSTWNQGITCQNSSAIPEINTKTQWGPEVQALKCRTAKRKGIISTWRNKQFITVDWIHSNRHSPQFETHGKL
jgi:hypothetical protein